MAVRAGHGRIGQEAVLVAIRDKSASLVIVAADVGANAAKKYADKCAYYSVPLLKAADRKTLGIACGRSQVVAVAVTDPGFAQRVLADLRDSNGGDVIDEIAGV
ncbi:50S ribosomal protein L7ae [Alicyclobacillaceae bacterium I2511]|nr:50S ribosomal protein L7ae [Alicyclobacillaceae bacterium I2511]